MKQLPEIGLSDPVLERVRRDHAEAIRELQRFLPIIVKNVVLEDSTSTHVAHGLGQVPRAITTSVPRGAIATAGRIGETTDASLDRSKTVVLTATGWGATITVDVMVWR